VIECPDCDKENRPTARFCVQCGSKFPVGEVLGGQYRVTRMLKVGGMAAVYEVESGGQRYALKEMRDRFTSRRERQDAINRFLREAMTLAKLDHPCIPTVHNHFIEGDRYYVVMDYVDGEDLADVIARAPGGRLPAEQVIDWGLQICEVLAYLHSRRPPIVFRDMKPSNLMLTPQGEIKLIDFGIARLFNPAQRGGASLVGTPGYAAPEQYQGVAEPRSDIYGLGATLHHLLTGCDPTDTGQRLFHFAPIRQYAPSLSPALEGTIQRALSMKMEDRFETVEEMRQALEEARSRTSWRERITEFVRRSWSKADVLTWPPLRWAWLAALVVALALVALLTRTPVAGALDRRLAFVREQGGVPEIHVMDAKGHITPLTRHSCQDDAPSWSPDKRRIAFAANCAGNWDIYWANADGTSLTRVTQSPAPDIEPAWSPDGGYIAFTSQRDGKREIYAAGPEGIMRITYTPGDGESWEPAWGPQGTIFFTSNRTGKREVYRTDPSGQVARVTSTPGGAESWSAAWSWTGSYTAFTSNRDGQPEVYVLPADGQLRRVTNTPRGSASWDPVTFATYLTFTSDRSGKPEVYAATQEKIEQLTRTTGDSGSWSPAW
jgi:tRNA A-37 threonylcarbamoyl transferase component Bud32